MHKNKDDFIRIPILMYHNIGEPERKEDAPFFVSAKRFKKQMECLHKANYRVIALANLVNYLKSETPLFEKLIVVTFDDGAESVYTEAFPVLRLLGVKTAVFLTINYIDQKEMPEKPFLKYRPLLWQQVKEMQAYGISFYPHSLTHPRLTEVNRDEAYFEISESKRILEERLGQKSDFFAYPYGSYNRETIEMVKRAGYIGAAGAWGGINTKDTDVFELKRIPVFERDTNLQLKLKLIFGVDKVTLGFLRKYYWSRVVNKLQGNA